MFKNLINFWKGKDFLSEVLKDFDEMLKDGEIAFTIACHKLIGASSFEKEEEIKISELQELAQKFGLADSFIFTGWLEDPRIALAVCDIGVVASTNSEVISRATQEFFAFGIPVIATRINVLPEMVQAGENGLLISPGDPAESIRLD